MTITLTWGRVWKAINVFWLLMVVAIIVAAQFPQVHGTVAGWEWFVYGAYVPGALHTIFTRGD